MTLEPLKQIFMFYIWITSNWILEDILDVSLTSSATKSIVVLQFVSSSQYLFVGSNIGQV